LIAKLDAHFAPAAKAAAKRAEAEKLLREADELQAKATA
jgi:hypothetical protein